MHERCAIFISTLNEIEGLTALFDRIPLSAFDECYALDGGSTDGTVEFFRAHHVDVIPGVKKGAIFNVGAMATTCENLVFFAPDGNEDPGGSFRCLRNYVTGTTWPSRRVS